MQYRILILTFILIVVACISCIDEISLDLDNDEQFVIVDGVVGDTPGDYEIRINYSPKIGVGLDNILEPISDAKVMLIDGAGAIVDFREKFDDLGKYTAFVALDKEQSYILDIVLPNGDNIVSEAQSVPPVKPEIANVDFDVIDINTINETGNTAQREFVEVYVTTAPTDENAFLRWRVRGEYQFIEKYPRALNPRNCYINQNVDLNNIKIKQTSDFEDGIISNFPILRTPFNERFNIVYLFNVSQHSVSEREYEYWRQTEQLINIDGTLFDPPPGIINGNLTNLTNPDENIQGYFSISAISFERFFAQVSTKGFFIDTPCTTNSFRPNPARCADCTTINGSSLTKPDYWRF